MQKDIAHALHDAEEVVSDATDLFLQYDVDFMDIFLKLYNNIRAMILLRTETFYGRRSAPATSRWPAQLKLLLLLLQGRQPVA